MDHLEHAKALAGVLRANARRLYRQAEEQRRLAAQLEDAVAQIDPTDKEDTEHEGTPRDPEEAHKPHRAQAAA
jgi:hypothetical protein